MAVKGARGRKGIRIKKRSQRWMMFGVLMDGHVMRIATMRMGIVSWLFFKLHGGWRITADNAAYRPTMSMLEILRLVLAASLDKMLSLPDVSRLFRVSMITVLMDRFTKPSKLAGHTTRPAKIHGR